MLCYAGKGFAMRKIAGQFKQLQTLTIEGDSIHVVMTMGPKTKDFTFKLDEPFEDEQPDGVKQKVRVYKNFV